MIKKIIYIENACYLSADLEQLRVKYRETKETKSVPIEDVGTLILDSPQILISNRCLNKLAESNVAVMICDDKRLPVCSPPSPVIGSKRKESPNRSRRARR